MAITFSNALTVAQMELNRIQNFGGRSILLPEYAREISFGWVIPWAQRDFRATKDLTAGGNGPFFVDRHTGAVCQVGPAVDLEAWLRAYAAKRRNADAEQV